MNSVIIYANLIIALVSAAFGIVAMVRPKAVNPRADGSPEEGFFVLLYAARTISFGLLAGILPLFSSGWTIAALLVAAALIQLADVGIAVSRRITGMAIGAALAAIVHIACVFAIL